MFRCRVNDQTELRLMDRQHAGALFKLLERNRQYLRRWHPWVELMRSVPDVERAVAAWQQQHVGNHGFYAGIWHEGRLCGAINHLNVDWVNCWTALSYWLDADHQGRGIMTHCCRTLIQHAFDEWNLNRVTIECAVENHRSRAVAERLGFKLEGTIRGVEWLHDHHADHVIYGLLRSDWGNLGRSTMGDFVRGGIARVRWNTTLPHDAADRVV